MLSKLFIIFIGYYNVLPKVQPNIFLAPDILNYISKQSNHCKTSVLAIPDSHVKSGQEIEGTITSYLRLSIEACIILIRIEKKLDSTGYFDKLYSYEELNRPGYPGPIRHSTQCQLVYIFNSFTETTLALLFQHVVRPSKDNFLYISELSAIDAFRKSSFSLDIRYKVYIQLSKFSKLENIDESSSRDRKCSQMLQGRRLVVATITGNPSLRFQNNPDGSLMEASRIHFHLLQDSAKRYNFTYRIQYSSNRGSSGFLKNGRWHGNVGDVFHRVADIGLGCGLTFHRSSAVDNGFPTENVARVFFIRAPPPSLSWKAIFHPFQPRVWLFLGLTLVALVIAYFTVSHVQRRSRQHGPSNATKFSTVVTSIIEIWCEQPGNEFNWSGRSIKTLITFWMGFCLVMRAGYRSRLIFFLTFNMPDEVPLTHRAIVAENYKLLYRYYGGVAYKHAQDSKDPMQHEIIRRALLVNSSEECILGALTTENAACLDWNQHGSYAMHTNATVHVQQERDFMFQSIDSVMSGLPVAWIFRKGSPLIEVFDSYIFSTLAAGIYHKWVENDLRKTKLNAARWLNENRHLEANKRILDLNEQFVTKNKALTLPSLYGIFSMLGVGVVLALCILILEIVRKFSSIQAKLQFMDFQKKKKWSINSKN